MESAVHLVTTVQFLTMTLGTFRREKNPV
jgi:hypothetical protein